MNLPFTRRSRYAMLILLTGSFMGCGGNSEFPLAQVSGKITHNGEPVPHVVVMFFPKSNKENINSGPYSTGESDQDGVYKLKTRYDRPGAVIGTHRVELAFADFDPEAAASELERQDSGEEPAAAVAKPLRKVKIPKKWGLDSQMEMTVPAEGTTTLNIEFNE